jgi:hypothetical protein
MAVCFSSHRMRLSNLRNENVQSNTNDHNLFYS